MKVDSPFISRVPKDIRENLRWRRAVHERVRDDPSYAAVIVDACAKDPLFFLSAFAYTYDPRREPFPKVPFILYPFQEQAVLSIISAFNSDDLVIEKSRDMGASWICTASFYWAWRFRKGLSFLMVSRNVDYVDKRGNPKALFWKLDYLQDNLPKWLLPRDYNPALHRKTLHFENPEGGSVIDGESTTPNVARGDRRTAILMDEHAEFENAEAVQSATRDATKCRIYNSTHKGTGTVFFRLSRSKHFKKLRIHWSEHPLKSVGLYTTDEHGNLKVLDPEGYPEGYEPLLDGKIRSPWYDKECRRADSKREIAEQLDINPEGSGFQFFDPDAIQEKIRKYAREPMAKGNLDYDSATAEPTRFREDPGGSLELWTLLDRGENPPPDRKYVIGADISAGTGASNSCASVWDMRSREKVAEFASPYVRPEEFAKQTVALAHWFNEAFLIWESNGPGRQFGSRVLELHYGNVYLRRRDEAISRKVSDIPGWASTPTSKYALMSDYRAAIESGDCINRSKEAMEETLDYVFTQDTGVSHSRATSKGDPTGAKANHGDRVMGDALAVKGLSERQSKKIVPGNKPKIPVGSLAWRREQQEKAKVGDGWQP